MICDKSSKSYSARRGPELVIRMVDIRMGFMIWCCYKHELVLIFALRQKIRPFKHRISEIIRIENSGPGYYQLELFQVLVAIFSTFNEAINKTILL